MATTEFFIGSRKVSSTSPPLVIAEIGINHNGSLSVAKEMVDAAFAAGAEIIKHQTHVIEDEMSSAAKSVIPGNADISIYEIMKNCHLNEDDERELMNYVHSKGMIFISTPFSRAAADRLEKFDVVAYKIGSGECNNYPLVRHIASFGKPIILSTGMNTIESISKSVEIFREHNIPFALLHCTNVYPTPYEFVRLDCIRELQVAFPDAIVGLSDHSIGNQACLGAVAVGASILERHFTDSKERTGPDIICSMDPKELSTLINDSKIIALCRGGGKGPIELEKPCIDFAFATIVTIEPIKKGEKLTKKNIWVKRPGTGEILAERYDDVLGKTVNKDLEVDVHLSMSDIL